VAVMAVDWSSRNQCTADCGSVKCRPALQVSAGRFNLSDATGLRDTDHVFATGPRPARHPITVAPAPRVPRSFRIHPRRDPTESPFPPTPCRSLVQPHLSVFNTTMFESLDLKSSFSICRYTFRIFRSSSYTKVNRSRSRLQEQKSVCRML